MKHIARLFACALALTLPAIGWAQAGAIADEESARNFGELTARYFTSAAYNTAACNVRKVQSTEETLANIFLTSAALRTGDTWREKVAYDLGLFAGWAGARADEFEDCRPSYFNRIPLDFQARAAAVMLLMIADDVNHLARGTQIQILEEFAVQYGPESHYSTEERDRCEETFFAEVGVPTRTLRLVFLDQVAEVICR
jgi:hypothetical protein